MSELPYGMVSLNLKNGMHMFILGTNGSLTLEGDDLRIRMSPELVHRMIDFLQEKGYDRTPLPKPVIETTYYKDEPDCPHEAWEVDSAGLATKCSDCGEPLPMKPIDEWTCHLCGWSDPDKTTTVHSCRVLDDETFGA